MDFDPENLHRPVVATVEFQRHVGSVTAATRRRNCCATAPLSPRILGFAEAAAASVLVATGLAMPAPQPSVRFLGPISRVHRTLPDGRVISAQMASAQARTFTPGDSVTVGLEPTGVLVVPESRVESASRA